MSAIADSTAATSRHSKIALERYNEMLPSAELARLATAQSSLYGKADPFPHAVFDGLFDEGMLDAVHAEYDASSELSWKEYDAPHEVKRELSKEEALGPHTRALLHNLNAAPFLRFLEELSDIQGLISDPHLSYGGLHEIRRGGKLGIHADFNKNIKLGLDRRLNVLLYLNRDWQDQWGGHLELWDRKMERCARKVAPLFNRMVIFSTDRDSFHGHPDPLECPPERARRSIALYYYTNGRPAEDDASMHGTLFQDRPGTKARWEARQVIKRFVPPILIDLKRALRG